MPTTVFIAVMFISFNMVYFIGAYSNATKEAPDEWGKAQIRYAPNYDPIDVGYVDRQTSLSQYTDTNRRCVVSIHLMAEEDFTITVSCKNMEFDEWEQRFAYCPRKGTYTRIHEYLLSPRDGAMLTISCGRVEEHEEDI